MNPLIIKGTEVTLGVNLDKNQGLFEFTGKSRPENVIAFFEPIFDWFDSYSAMANEKTTVVFRLEYYNSSSAKVLLRFLVRLESYLKKGLDINIHWMYREGDEDMMESGEDYASLVELPFEFFEFN